MTEMEFRDFAEALRYYLNAAGFTYRQAAEKAGVESRTIDSWVAAEHKGGARNPSTDNLEAVADVLEQALGEARKWANERRWTRERREWEEEGKVWMEEMRAEFVALGHRRNARFASTPAVPAGANHPQLRHNPFIGRESEKAEIHRRLLDPDVHLLTLTGPPGVGKTRLALEVADGLRDSFPDGVYSVSLAPLVDPSLVASTIGQTLGVKEIGESTLGEMLTERLRGRRLLLVLDNFEHLLAAALDVARMLEACEGAKVLVTSRALLNLSVEHRFPVRPFTVPDSTLLPDLDALGQNDAVALFLRRAKAVEPSFDLTDENAAAVLGICQANGGIPLAIGLAAARVGMFSPNAMLVRLEGRPSFLAGGPVDAPMRQRSLWETITWSYDLLSLADRRLFARFALFPGGCTLESAEEVCNVDGDLGPDVLPGLASLINWSLLESDGRGRFSMLQPIRGYAHKRLEASGETENLRKRHAEYFLKLVVEAEAKLRGPRQIESLDRLDAEHNNLRAVMQWCLESGEPKMWEMALRLGGGLWEFWYRRGYLSEGRGWLDLLLARCGDRFSAVRARALLGAGVLAWSQCDYEPAESLLKASLDVSGELEDKRNISDTLCYLGILAADRVNYEEAHSLYERARMSFQNLGDECGIGLALNLLGDLALRQDNYVSAERLFKGGLTRLQNVGHKQGVSWALDNLARASHRRGDYARAADLYGQCLEMYRELGDKRGIAQALSELGRVASGHEDYQRAAALFGESLTLSQDMGDRGHVIMCLEGFARVAHSNGQLERAVRLCGALAALREGQGTPLPSGELTPCDHVLATIRAVLAGDALTAMWAEGRAMTMAKATEYALSPTMCTP